ncbi:MAG: DUF4810 domain-containing protein [Candidatus Brocadiales bacterium]
MSIKYITLLLAILLGLSGCTTTKYHWGNYEKSLYKYYKDPSEVEKLAKSLDNMITKGESKGKVPPGIYAEYAYILYISKKPREAIMYFEKEKTLWPESSVFMDKMIDMAKPGVPKKSSQSTEQNPEGGGTQ